MKKLYAALSRYKFPVLAWFVLGFVFLSRPAFSEILSLPVEASSMAEAPSPALSRPEKQKREPIHILLIGQDRREDEPRSRSDCMIICSFQPDDGKLTLTSFLRDLYVQIPGFGKNRLNAAYVFGGMPLIRQTFQENFGIPVTGCVEVDFNGFSQLVDLVDGVFLSLREDEANHLNWEVPGGTLRAGMQHLNGQQALAYSRIRSLDEDGDFSRTDRQRKLLLALADRCKQSSVSDLLQLFRKASSMVSTDIRKGELLLLIRGIGPRLSRLEVSSQRIPAEGTYQHRIMDGMAVLVADLGKARTSLQETIGIP